MPLLEICVSTPAAIAEAVAGGADRIELCCALELGGLTPSVATVDLAVETGVPVHVLVRPAAGGFVLDADDVALIVADIGAVLARGAAGVVVGALRPDGALDREALARFRDAARDATIVLNRAIDLVADPVAAVGIARALGYDKVLSSGGATTAAEGAAVLASIIAAGGPTVIAAGGVRPDGVAALILATGVAEVHSSASVLGPAPDERLVRLGFARGPARRTDRAIVSALRAAIEGVEPE